MDLKTARRVRTALDDRAGADYATLAAVYVLPEAQLGYRPGLAVDFPHHWSPSGKTGTGVILQAVLNDISRLSHLVVRTAEGVIEIPVSETITEGRKKFAWTETFNARARYTAAEADARKANFARVLADVKRIIAAHEAAQLDRAETLLDLLELAA